MVIPEYPNVKEYRWSQEELDSLPLEQVNALWIHASTPFRYLIWEALDESKRRKLFLLFDAGQAAKLHFMWRGFANVRHTKRVGDFRQNFIADSGVTALEKFWPFMVAGEKRTAFLGLTDSESAALLLMLPPSEKLITWRYIGEARRAGIWTELDDENKQALEGLITSFRVTLESICIDGKCPLDFNLEEHHNAFNEAFHDIQLIHSYVTVSEMAKRLEVTDRTIRNRAAAYGYTVRKGDIHPPSSSST